jgi:hypothetical protein
MYDQVAMNGRVWLPGRNGDGGAGDAGTSHRVRVTSSPAAAGQATLQVMMRGSRTGHGMERASYRSGHGLPLDR